MLLCIVNNSTSTVPIIFCQGFMRLVIKGGCYKLFCAASNKVNRVVYLHRKQHIAIVEVTKVRLVKKVLRELKIGRLFKKGLNLVLILKNCHLIWKEIK